MYKKAIFNSKQSQGTMVMYIQQHFCLWPRFEPHVNLQYFRYTYVLQVNQKKKKNKTDFVDLQSFRDIFFLFVCFFDIFISLFIVKKKFTPPSVK